MALTVWIYVFTAQGRFQAVSAADWRRFMDGKLRFEPDACGRMRYAQVIAENKDRKAVRLTSVLFFYVPLDAAGRADGARIARSAISLLDPSTRGRAEEFVWEPPRRAVAELNGLINRRAKALLASGPQRFHVITGGGRAAKKRS